jgi:FMN reductase
MATALAEAVYNADGLIWSTPLYHGTVSGAFKNAIDWLQLIARHEPPYLSGKVVGLICAAGGTHGLQAINTMEFMVRSLRGWTVPLVAPISRASRAFDTAGNFKEPAVENLIYKLGEEVVKGAKAMQAG